MNKLDRKMLLLAKAAINIPLTRNRMSAHGYTMYDSAMREKVLPTFNWFILHLVDGDMDIANSYLLDLVNSSIEVFAQCEISPPNELVEWQRAQQSVHAAPHPP